MQGSVDCYDAGKMFENNGKYLCISKIKTFRALLHRDAMAGGGATAL